ncbi:UDP-glycosyltransferase 85K12 [Cinnamomum micranthum f. kanehirae]|uniref:UDP-glycosyltransferase 85K12 n=1 Tax=Cinnamomum micranthum f. kanehirae TaxID=337451 RepID=A0A443PAI9_9MAGN|nr:UDP-glycosyltransferase 85K12 [Cinnamomum micranthum f. kanehirae]
MGRLELLEKERVIFATRVPSTLTTDTGVFSAPVLGSLTVDKGVKDQKRWKRKGERYIEEMKKPHVVCIPAPAQGHINPVMQLAKLLHSRGFFITFVNTDFTHRCQGQESLEFLDGFALKS